MNNVLLSLLGIGAFVGGAALLMLQPTSEIAAEAETVVEKCATAGDKVKCYEDEVPNLYPGLGVEEIFDVVRHVRELDPEYQFCHVLGHGLGELVVAEDPRNWIDAIPFNPRDGLCSNGFIHGVIGGRFRAEVLDNETLEKHIPDFSRACEPRDNWSPSALDQAMCYHGMGHLYMFITDADLPNALSLCERTAGGGGSRQDFRRVCREGVFMQIYQPLEPDDFLLIERMAVQPTKETVRKFCARYQRDEYEGACLRESWPFFREEIIDGTGIGEFCSDQPNAEEETACYQSAFAILGRMSLGDTDNILRACGEVPESQQPLCYESGAQAVLEENRDDVSVAIGLCERTPEEHRAPCLQSLVSKVNFNFAATEQAKNFCDSLPPDMRNGCIAGIR